MILTQEQLWCLTHPEQAELQKWLEVKDEIVALNPEDDGLIEKVRQIDQKMNRDGYLCMATSIRQVFEGGAWPACTTKCTFYRVHRRSCVDIFSDILGDLNRLRNFAAGGTRQEKERCKEKLLKSVDRMIRSLQRCVKEAEQ